MQQRPVGRNKRAIIGVLARVLLLVIALILYGCLYPFHFTPRPGLNPLGILPRTWVVTADRFMLRDLVLNLLLYLPVGLFGFLTFLRRSAKWVAALFTLVLGLCVSTCVELVQFYDASRYSSAVDIVANVLGTAFGIVVGVIWSATIRKRVRGLARPVRMHPSAAMLLLLWIIWRLFPVFPHLSTTAVRQKLAEFAHTPLALVPLVSAAVEWFFIGRLLTQLGVPSVHRWLAATVLLIPAELFLRARQPSPAVLAGAVCGVAAFYVFGQVHRAAALTAVMMQALLLFRGLAPFHLSAAAHSFQWVPFSPSLETPLRGALTIILGKAFYYGAAIWALRMCGIRMQTAILITAANLAIIEAVQRYLPGRTPEITDPVLAIVAGLFLITAESQGKPAR